MGPVTHPCRTPSSAPLVPLGTPPTPHLCMAARTGPAGGAGAQGPAVQPGGAGGVPRQVLVRGHRRRGLQVGACPGRGSWGGRGTRGAGTAQGAPGTQAIRQHAIHTTTKSRSPFERAVEFDLQLLGFGQSRRQNQVLVDSGGQLGDDAFAPGAPGLAVFGGKTLRCSVLHQRSVFSSRPPISDIFVLTVSCQKIWAWVVSVGESWFGFGRRRSLAVGALALEVST